VTTNKKFKDFIGEWKYRDVDGFYHMVEVRPAFRVLIHEPEDNVGELFFLNRKQLEMRMLADGWQLVAGYTESKVLPVRKTSDSSDGPVHPPEGGFSDRERDLQRVLDDPRYLSSPSHTIEEPRPIAEADPTTEKWVRFEHRKVGKFNLWHQVKSITATYSQWTRHIPEQEINWVTTQFRCGNVIQRGFEEFKGQVEYGPRPDRILACGACFYQTRPFVPKIVGLSPEYPMW
jgi:hypothetical protein